MGRCRDAEIDRKKERRKEEKKKERKKREMKNPKHYDLSHRDTRDTLCSCPPPGDVQKGVSGGGTCAGLLGYVDKYTPAVCLDTRSLRL
jgi:hypothetical protein